MYTIHIQYIHILTKNDVKIQLQNRTKINARLDKGGGGRHNASYVE